MITYILLPFQAVGNHGFLGQLPITMANQGAAQNYNVRGLNQCFPVVSDNFKGSDTQKQQVCATAPSALLAHKVTSKLLKYL